MSKTIGEIIKIGVSLCVGIVIGCILKSQELNNKINAEDDEECFDDEYYEDEWFEDDLDDECFEDEAEEENIEEEPARTVIHKKEDEFFEDEDIPGLKILRN